MAKEWDIPLIRFDMGSIFNSLVGQSEENMRMSLAQVESLAPVILWIDEMEKGLAGSGGGANDSGTTQRVFGTLLSWMQERTKDKLIYVAATVNNVQNLPPELLRKGRFDEIFWVDLPPSKERREILEIHLRKNDQPMDFSEKEWGLILDVSKNFSGAELENAVQDAMYEAFYTDVKGVTSNHLVDAISSTVPLAQTMETSIALGREWAKTRCRMAQKQEVENILSPDEIQIGRKVVI
jgi:SpoVK/Ycf46/Vps4 family AAA+-type ATPase